MITSGLGSLFRADSSNNFNNIKVPIGQSQQLKKLTGLSENGVNALVSYYASKNEMSVEESANELIHQLQNGNGSSNPSKLVDIFKDVEQSGIPDFVREMLKERQLSQPDATAFLESLGVSSSHIDMFIDSVYGDDSGAKSDAKSFNFSNDVSAMEF